MTSNELRNRYKRILTMPHLPDKWRKKLSECLTDPVKLMAEVDRFNRDDHRSDVIAVIPE